VLDDLRALVEFAHAGSNTLPLSSSSSTVPLRRNLTATDRQEAIRTERFGVEIEKLTEMARRLRAKLENCYVEIKRYTVTVGAEEKKNSEFRNRTG
jgi:hypothetical protein